MKDLDNIKEIHNNEIKNLIYYIRGKQVMLDSDVAMLYHYETKNINKAMKRNIERFPEDFCFRLNKEELEEMWFQNGTTFKNNFRVIPQLCWGPRKTYSFAQSNKNPTQT